MYGQPLHNGITEHISAFQQKQHALPGGLASVESLSLEENKITPAQFQNRSFNISSVTDWELFSSIKGELESSKLYLIQCHGILSPQVNLSLSLMSLKYNLKIYFHKLVFTCLSTCYIMY